MKKRVIFKLTVFALISAVFGCAGAKFNAYSKYSGYLPVSLSNKDATVVVIVKDIIKVNTHDQEALSKILEEIVLKDRFTPIDDIEITMDENYITLVVTRHGSGTVIAQNKEGTYILTNWHVVSKDNGEDQPFICVGKEMGGNCSPALVLAKDKDYDTAALFTDELKLRNTVKIGVDEKFYKPGRKIYNWGFPIWYKKTVGWGYLSTTASPQSFFGKGARLLGQLPNGPGTSGSGIFDAKTHLLIGMMQGSAIYNHFIIRYFIPSTYIKKFLDEKKIPYNE